MLTNLGRWVAHHRLPVVLVWTVLVIAGFVVSLGVVGDGLFARLSGGEPTVRGEAETGSQLLADADPSGQTLTLLVERADLGDQDVPRLVGEARTELADLAGVAAVAAPFPAADGAASPGADQAAQALISADRDGFVVTVSLDHEVDGAQEDQLSDAVEDRLTELGTSLQADDPGVSWSLGGGELVAEAVIEQMEEDLRSGETIAVSISLLVMLFVFGGLLAAGVPVIGAVASIAGAFTALMGFAALIDLDSTVVNVVTVLGLGLCIDYGLLLVSRFREELHRATAAQHDRGAAQDGRSDARGPDARTPETEVLTRRQRRTRSDVDVAAVVGTTLATAGRTVLFSGLIVATSLAGLLLFDATILRSMGAAGMSVVAVALLVALTLVPALLALAGDRLSRRSPVLRLPGLRRLADSFGEIAPAEGVFSRLAHRVQRHPWLVTLGVTAGLLLVAAPVLQMRLVTTGAEMLPAGHPQRAFLETLDSDYPALRQAPVQVVSNASPAEIAPWAEDLADIEGVESVAGPRPVGDLSVLDVHVGDEVDGVPRDAAVVTAIRADRPDEPVWVTGRAAAQVDFDEALSERAPWAIGLVVLATLVLLFLMTGSVLIPLKALAMNVVSLGATLGILVWGFQDGHLAGLLGFTPPGGVEAVILPIVLAIGFGLAMDYEVFLLSRIKEVHDTGASSDEAVVTGLQRSGRIISSAALIVVLVFSGFIIGDLMLIQMTGVALALAVAVDATLVRMLLVPATMTLLGDWNWWAPRPLRRLHDWIGVSH